MQKLRGTLFRDDTGWMVQLDDHDLYGEHRREEFVVVGGVPRAIELAADQDRDRSYAVVVVEAETVAGVRVVEVLSEPEACNVVR